MSFLKCIVLVLESAVFGLGHGIETWSLDLGVILEMHCLVLGSLESLFWSQSC